MNYKEQYLDALTDFSEAISIQKSLRDITKEKKIQELSNTAIQKLQSIIQLCKTKEDITALCSELGLNFNKELIEKVFGHVANGNQSVLQTLLHKILNEMQNMLQEQIIPNPQYKRWKEEDNVITNTN